MKLIPANDAADHGLSTELSRILRAFWNVQIRNDRIQRRREPMPFELLKRRTKRKHRVRGDWYSMERTRLGIHPFQKLGRLHGHSENIFTRAPRLVVCMHSVSSFGQSQRDRSCNAPSNIEIKSRCLVWLGKPDLSRWFLGDLGIAGEKVKTVWSTICLWLT